MKLKKFWWSWLVLFFILSVFPSCRRKIPAEQWVKDVKLKSQLQKHQAPLITLAISPRGKLMASSDRNGKLLVWDLAKEEPKKEFSFHDSQFFSLAFSPDGKYLAGGSREKLVVIYDVINTEFKAHSPELSDTVLSLAWLDKKTVASGSCKQFDARGWCAGGEIWLWKIGDKLEEVRHWDAHQEYINTMAVNPTRKYLASAGSDREIMVWDPNTGNLLKALPGHEQRVNVLVFSQTNPDLLVSASLDGTVRLWDVAQGKELNLLYETPGEIYGMTLSPDGKIIAAAGKEPNIVLWDLASGKKLKEIAHQNGITLALGFTPDGRELVAGFENSIIAIFAP